MNALAALVSGVTVAAMAALVGSASALAATFVYVSNAEDGDIGVYRMLDTGELQAGARVKVASLVMPMAVSPNRRFLYAASRSKPYTVHFYAINAVSGELTPLSTAPLVESFPYISLDKTGRFLFGASYGGHLISVNAVGDDGRVAAEPLQVIPVGRNAHSIRVDNDNKFVYVPTLGSDEIYEFIFDATSGRLTSNTPPVHMSPNGRFLYISERTGSTLAAFGVDGATGKLTYLSSTPTERQPRGFAIDPKGRFLVAAGEKSETISIYAIDQPSGALRLLNRYPTGKGANWVEMVSFD